MLSVASFLFLTALIRPQVQPAPPDCTPLPLSTAPAAEANDNRSPAGTIRDGILELRLLARPATWHPEGESGCGIGIVALAEEGKQSQTPGPLIRVPVGTRLRVTFRNAHTAPLVVRGLEDHLRDTTALMSGVVSGLFGLAFVGTAIPPDSSQTFDFQATVPGTFFYHASLAATPPGAVAANELGQAVGAFIVDPPEPAEADRIFVMTRWRPPGGSEARARGFELTAFNGRSWPHTEPLTAKVGETEKWRIIAANNDGHAMHLHGFYFQVESRGSMAYDDVLSPERRELAVTQGMGPGRTFTMRWTPERPGNWLFHCHLVRHMSGAQRLDRMPGAPGAAQALDPAHDSHAMHEMAGLVLGIRVDPPPGATAIPEESPRATLRLFANRRDSVFGGSPGYGFVLQEGSTPPRSDSVRLPGSMLLLRRGEPTQITVVNRTRQALGVHWHGLELESYYDGVAGWSGAGERIAPPVAHGDSFAVRLTPPRAGTFIYHVHNERGEELVSGLYGPLIVTEPEASWDSDRERVLTISEAGPGDRLGAERPPFVNGTVTPDTVVLVAGRAYRFRIVSITANLPYSLALEQDGRVVDWLPLARDGADLLMSQGRPEPAYHPVVDQGVTLDYEFQSTAPGLFALVLRPITAGVPQERATIVPIRVR